MDDRCHTLTNLCEDVVLLISDCLLQDCSDSDTPLKTLSSVNRRFRNVVSPVLFKSLYVNRPLSQLGSAPNVLKHARTLKIDMFGSMWWWCSGKYVSSNDALDLFACMQGMKCLKRLEVTMMKRNLDIFTSAFQEVADPKVFLLPGIDTLIVTSAAAFLASHCPDLEHLILEDGPSCMIETYHDVSTRLLPLHPQIFSNQYRYTRLMHFDTTASWSAEEISALVPCFPNLQYLHMRSDAFCYRASVATIMHLLGGGLGNLRTLKLNKVGNLDMGFRAVWKRSITACSTEAQRRMLWLQNEGHRVEAENNVVRLAFTSIDGLKECWLGDKRVARRSVGCSDHNDLSWIWERKREDIDVCTNQSEWASYRAEKEAVVVCSEVCT